MEIGLKIKEQRLQCGLTQEELADRCELTKGYISQLENDLTSPSIATLQDILAALGTDLKHFFAEETPEKIVFTENDFITKETAESALTWLVPNSQKNMMEPILLELQPGASSGADMPHEGEEFGFVLEGSVRLHLGDKNFVVKAGESFYYSAAKIHFLECVGKQPAKLIWVSTPPNF